MDQSALHVADLDSILKQENMFKFFIFFCFIILAHGNLGNGSSEDKVGIYELKKGDFSIKVTNYGARIVSVNLPDKNGKLADVVLGYDTVNEYMNESGNFGAIVGRVASRISGAQFTLNGTRYKLDANGGNGTYTIHGGRKGFGHVIWKVKKHEIKGPSPYITLSYYSADGEQGFPGAVWSYITYAISSPYKLSVTMKSKALNKATPVDLGQHSFWNLGGHDSGDILSHELQISASSITTVDKNLIPTGEIVSVKKTPYDFLSPHVIKTQMKELPNGSIGYDINYGFNGHKIKKMKPVAVLYNKKSGRVMKISSNAPSVHLYTGNNLNNVKGKCGYIYEAYAGLSLETEGFPDSVNHPNFPSNIVTPGKSYEHYMLYTFTINKD